MVLDKDFREFVTLLNDAGVRYRVVGGYAVAYHGYPRYTGDLDLWVWTAEDNALKILQVIKSFGLTLLNLEANDLQTPGNVIQIGFPPHRIDLITDLDALDFETTFAKKEEVDIDGLKVNFIDFQSLIENKKATGRTQDHADIEKLLEEELRTRKNND